MKNKLSVLLIAALILVLAACRPTPPEAALPTETAPASSENTDISTVTVPSVAIDNGSAGGSAPMETEPIYILPVEPIKLETEGATEPASVDSDTKPVEKEPISSPGEPETDPISVCLDWELDMSAYQNRAEITLDEDGAVVCITTGKELTDIVLEYGNWDMDGVVFTPEQKIFFSESMSPDTILVLHTYFSDVMPNIRITYKTKSGTEFSHFLFQSGMDGSIMLMDP